MQGIRSLQAPSPLRNPQLPLKLVKLNYHVTNTFFRFIHVFMEASTATFLSASLTKSKAPALLSAERSALLFWRESCLVHQ